MGSKGKPRLPGHTKSSCCLSKRSPSVQLRCNQPGHNERPPIKGTQLNSTKEVLSLPTWTSDFSSGTACANASPLSRRRAKPLLFIHWILKPNPFQRTSIFSSNSKLIQHFSSFSIKKSKIRNNLFPIFNTIRTNCVFHKAKVNILLIFQFSIQNIKKKYQFLKHSQTSTNFSCREYILSPDCFPEKFMRSILLLNLIDIFTWP